MPELFTDYGRVAQIGAYRLYVLHTGELIMMSNGVRLKVTPQEARDLLDILLIFARYFTGESQPLLAGGVNGHGKQ